MWRRDNVSLWKENHYIVALFFVAGCLWSLIQEEILLCKGSRSFPMSTYSFPRQLSNIRSRAICGCDAVKQCFGLKIISIASWLFSMVSLVKLMYSVKIIVQDLWNVFPFILDAKLDIIASDPDVEVGSKVLLLCKGRCV